MLLINITNEYDEGGSLCDFGDHGVSCKLECESISTYKDNKTNIDKPIEFFRLSNTKRPCSIPLTIEAKLSSRRIISAACFDTSQPVMPMAIPEQW